MRLRIPDIRSGLAVAALVVTPFAGSVAFAETPIWSITQDGGSLAAETPIWSISGPSVVVSIPNAAPTAKSGYVTVTAVVDGAVDTKSASFQGNAGSSVLVTVTFADPVQSVGPVLIIDDPNPM